MKVSWRKKSRWEQVLDPIASKVKGRELTVNGRLIKGEQLVKPAARAVGGLAIATVVSALVSTLRGQDGD
jgi:hypothetical protein